MLTKGSIKIDKGAEEAIAKKGKSLLPVGITEVIGNFTKGDNVLILSSDEKVIGQGLSNFTSDEILKIMGKREEIILKEFGSSLCYEVVHRNNMVIF